MHFLQTPIETTLAMATAALKAAVGGVVELARAKTKNMSTGCT